MRIDIITAGKLRNDPLKDIWDNYIKRLKWQISLYEIEDNKDLSAQMNALLNKRGVQIALDEKGKNLTSRQLSKKLESYALDGRTPVQFFIGAADGLPPGILDASELRLAFGAQTWPHKLARVMLIEQMYRACQIQAGHPYHRD